MNGADLAVLVVPFLDGSSNRVEAGTDLEGLDGGLFNLRRLQAKTKTSSAMISALQYADDVAFPSLTADGLQRNLDVMSETYLRAGLIINTTEAEILGTSSPDAPTFSISGNQP